MLGPGCGEVHAAPRGVLLLHPDREPVRGGARVQLLGQQPGGDPARAGAWSRGSPTTPSASSKHGFFGYLRHTCIIPEAPAILRYGLLMPIEFISNIIVRPITLTVRLTANFVAGHFLLAIFFLGTVFFLEDGPKTWLARGVIVPARVDARRARDLRRGPAGVHLRRPQRLLHRAGDGGRALAKEAVGCSHLIAQVTGNLDGLEDHRQGPRDRPRRDRARASASGS